MTIWDPTLNRVVSKPCYNEPCCKEVEVIYKAFRIFYQFKICSFKICSEKISLFLLSFQFHQVIVQLMLMYSLVTKNFKLRNFATSWLYQEKKEN